MFQNIPQVTISGGNFNHVLGNQHISPSSNEKADDRKEEEARRMEIEKWLSAPDPSTNHHGAFKARQPGTGGWFVEGEPFATWKTDSCSLLLLFGIRTSGIPITNTYSNRVCAAGSGKTILRYALYFKGSSAAATHRALGSSIIVEDLIRYCANDISRAIAYFYFDFNDTDKQYPDNLVRSLIQQFAARCDHMPDPLVALYSLNQPVRTDALVAMLREILASFCDTYVVIDALDECADRTGLLHLFEQVVSWKIERLHFLVTSREMREIEETLVPLAFRKIIFERSVVNRDIEILLDDRLEKNPKLKRFPEVYKIKAKKTLLDQANGM